MRNALTDVSGIAVGHWTDAEAGTGCTVILTPEGATGGVDIRGSAPGTRETDLLDPICQVDSVHGLALSGGSAFGLGTADGVMRWLAERGHGWETPVAPVPIVPAAILFDLAVGNAGARPSAQNAYAACESASVEDASRGNVGVGTGCTVGKLLGAEKATRGGLGQASLELPGGLVIAALVAVNALGDVVDPADTAIIAGVRDLESNRLVDGLKLAQRLFDQFQLRGPSLENTTIGVVATNARLSKVQCRKVAQMAHDGLARTVRPAHTMYDGDCFFTLATGAIDRPVELSLLGATAAEVIAAAVVDGVRSAEAGYGFPASSDLVPLMLSGMDT